VPLYPRLLTFVAGTTSSSIVVSATLTRDGYLYCTALASGSSTPSGSSIKASTYTTLVTANVLTNTTIAGLNALTDYDIYCYT
jgi:hypothetical protein